VDTGLRRGGREGDEETRTLENNKTQ